MTHGIPIQRDPKSLPNLVQVRRRAKALAMLDAIICPEWEDRYYSFNKNWGEGEEMASMRNGSGDDWFILFGSFGAAIKGLDHETKIAGDRLFTHEVQRQVPKTFSSFLAEPAFGMEWLSYCYWRGSEDIAWHKVVHPDPVLSKAPDGSVEYLALLVEPALSYQEFSNWYFELNVPLAIIDSIFEHTPLTTTLVRAINSELPIAKAIEFAAEIGYPIASVNA